MRRLERIFHMGMTALARIRSRTTGSDLIMRKRFLGSKSYADAFSAKWHEVFPASDPERSAPARYGRRSADLKAILDPIPALGVLELKDAFIAGPHGWIISSEGHLLPEHSWYGLMHADEMRIPRRPLPVKEVRGVCLSLASDWAGVNYGHFLLDGVCRFELFQKSGFSVSDVDHVYCAVPFPRASRLLERLGIAPEKCITAVRDTAVRADVVLAPTFPGTRRNYMSWAVDFLRRVYLENPPSPHRRLYIPRETTRRIVNEQRLISVLAEYGFEVFDPAASDDPPTNFAEAEIVVGGHGAGLADLAFCRPGTAVLELIPSDHIYPYWYTLADAAGLSYGYLVGESTHERPSGTRGPSPHDFGVDEGDFRDALGQIVGLRRDR